MTKAKTGKGKPPVRRAARKSSRPASASLAVFDGLSREILATQGRDLLRSGDPLEAEMWASHMIGLFGQHTLIGESDTVAAIGGRLVSVARRARTPAAQVCLCALAAVARDPLRRRARAALRDLIAGGVPAVAWIAGVGSSEPTVAWRATDPYGDQDSLMIGFRYPDGVEHTLVVLVDHVLGGTAKDAAVLGPIDEIVALWRATSDVEVVEEPAPALAGRVVTAIEATSCMVDPPVSDDYRDTEALLWARLEPFAIPFVEPAPLADDQREALVKEFLADRAGAEYAHDPGAWFLLDVMVDYRCDAHRRDPLRWSCGTAVTFLLDVVPRSITANLQSLARCPDVLRAWVQWGGQRSGLPAHLVAETVQAISDVEGEFLEAIADETLWGPAKRLAMGMINDGIDPSDQDAANAWLSTQTA